MFPLRLRKAGKEQKAQMPCGFEAQFLLSHVHYHSHFIHTHAAWHTFEADWTRLVAETGEEVGGSATDATSVSESESLKGQ